MSKADQAYQATLKKIEHAKATGALELKLFGEEFSALDRVPPELASLTNLQILELSGTQVNDLAPLQEMTNLQMLWLSGTQVSDLRPIAGLELRADSSNIGLYCVDTPATERDARLAELSQITNNATRARGILDYLRSLPPWPDPYMPEAAPAENTPKQDGAVPSPPEQDPALPLIWGEQGFSFFADSIFETWLSRDQ